MTAKSERQFILPEVVGQAAPAVGTYLASPSGVTVLLLTRVARIVGGQGYRIYALRLRKAMLPEGVTVLPWPKSRKAPSRAAEPPAPTERPPIVTRQQKQSAERKRVIAHRRSITDPAAQMVEPIRLANKTLEAADFRDPEDSNPNHRVPRTIHGYKNVTTVEALVKSGTITRAHARAATIFRNQYERAGKLGLGQSDWGAAKSGGFGPSAGLSEAQLFAMDSIRAVQKLLGKLYEIVESIVVADMTLREYGRRTKTNPTQCTGRFMAALDVLDAHFTVPTEDKERHTINRGAPPLEPSQPLAASRWAAD